MESHKYTIDACLRLHNHIVDYREAKKNITPSEAQDNEIITDENEELNQLSDLFLQDNPFHAFGGNQIDEIAQRGRVSNSINNLKLDGMAFRNTICHTIANRGMMRPTESSIFRYRDRHYRPVEA